MPDEQLATPVQSLQVRKPRGPGTSILFIGFLARRGRSLFTTLNQWNSSWRQSENKCVPAGIRESLQRPKLEQVWIVIHHSGSIGQPTKGCGLPTCSFQRRLSFFLSLHNLNESLLHFAGNTMSLMSAEISSNPYSVALTDVSSVSLAPNPPRFSIRFLRLLRQR